MGQQASLENPTYVRKLLRGFHTNETIARLTGSICALIMPRVITTSLSFNLLSKYVL